MASSESEDSMQGENELFLNEDSYSLTKRYMITTKSQLSASYTWLNSGSQAPTWE